ncbi:MAG TPA: substrate-binding domain-containing protein [Actinomycetes bacterium]
MLAGPFAPARAGHPRLGLRVPDDCAVVGCDDLPIVAHTIPPPTTVHVPFYETGGRAVALLLDRIAGAGKEPDRVLLPVELVVRGSCGAATPAPTGT